MLYLVTGMPGNGKTLYAVDWLLRQIETDADLVKSKGTIPRTFYTDIEGFDAAAVEKLTGYRVEPAPDDWRTTPKGSVLVYDEAHRMFPSTGRPGRAEDPKIRDMDTHRHGGYDMLFITQWPSKVHHELRQLVGEHVHLNRAMGLESAGLLRWSRVQPDPYDERQREKAEEEIWRFPKDRYALYTSSTLHTVSHKFRIPKKVWGALSTLLVTGLILWGLYAFLVPRSDSKAEGAGAAEGGASLLAPLSPTPVESSPLMAGMQAYASINTESAPSLAGCVASQERCRCFNTDGFQIDMIVQQCRALLAEPLPFNVYHEYRAPVTRDASATGEGTQRSVTVQRQEREQGTFPEVESSTTRVGYH